MDMPDLLIALYKYFPYGGLQKDTHRLICEAIQCGHRVVLFCTDWQGDIPQGLQLEIVHPKGLSNTKKMENFGKLFQARMTSWDGISLAMNRIPGADFYFAADACMKASLPCSLFGKLKCLLPRYRAILKQESNVFSVNEKTHYLLISEKQRSDFSNSYPDIPQQRYTLLPPGIDESCSHHTITSEKRQEMRESIGISSHDILLIGIGSNLLLKGVDRVLRTLKSLPQNTKYLLIGNSSEKKVKKLSQQLGISQERFRFIGPRNDVCDWLCAADLMVHPARSEGAGSVLLEAISCGLPVICTELCGFSPFVGQVSSECVIPDPFQQERLDNCVKNTIQKLPELRRKTAEYAKEHDFTTRTRTMLDILVQ